MCSSDLFACFKHWAIKKNMPFGTEQSFKRRFLASTQEHMVESDLVRNNGTRKHIYRGVKLNEKAQKYVDANIINEEGVF